MAILEFPHNSLMFTILLIFQRLIQEESQRYRQNLQAAFARLDSRNTIKSERTYTFSQCGKHNSQYPQNY